MLGAVIGLTRDNRRLEERALRVDAVLRMSTPPEHLSGKTLFPGAFLAVLVTAGALFALAVVIAVSPNGPARLWLDGGGSTVSLKESDGTPRAGTRADSPVGLLTSAPSPGLASGVSLGSPVAATDRPGAVRLRANTRVQRRTAARTPAARRPSTQAPASTPAPLQPVSQTTAGAPAPAAAPVATPAPASTMNRSRGRGTAPSKTAVPKQRVPKQAVAPAPTAAPPTSGTPGATPRSTPAPAPALRPVQGGPPPSTGVGAADGVLHRVPPTHP